MDLSPRVTKIKAKINKWDLIKLKSFCTVKETINKMKRQPLEWEKIFANNATDGHSFLKHTNSTIKLNIEKPNNPIKKWAAAAAAKSLQSCPTLCDPIDGSPPGSLVPGILQAKTLE